MVHDGPTTRKRMDANETESAVSLSGPTDDNTGKSQTEVNRDAKGVPERETKSSAPRESVAKARAKELSISTENLTKPAASALSTTINPSPERSETAIRILMGLDDSDDEEANHRQHGWPFPSPLEIIQRRRRTKRFSSTSSSIPASSPSRRKRVLAFLATLLISFIIAVFMMMVNRNDTSKQEGIVWESERPIQKMIRECSETGRFETSAILSTELLQRRDRLIRTLRGTISIEGRSDSCSSENQVLIWLASDDGVDLGGLTKVITRFVMGQLYLELGGPHWKKRTRWLQVGVDECQPWFGVQCTPEGFVRSLQMKGNSLEGIIPTTIGLLTHLEEIDFSHNRIRSSVPASIGKLTLLRRLSISNNALSSTLPTEMSKLTNLEWLHLDSNKGITGSMEELISTTLRYASKLKHLVLSNNQITGRIPESILHLSNLVVFNVDENSLDGKIPTAIAHLSMLETLSLSLNTAIHGSIPTQIRYLSRLRNLFLHSNSLTGHASGVWALRALRNLDLRNNQLEGTLPTKIGLLTNLGSLVVSQNKLVGTIPSEIGLLSQSLSSLNLSENRFEGTVPQELAQLTNIATSYEFRIYNDNITGPVAPGICQHFKKLEFCNTSRAECPCCVKPLVAGSGVGCAPS